MLTPCAADAPVLCIARLAMVRMKTDDVSCYLSRERVGALKTKHVRSQNKIVHFMYASSKRLAAQ